MPAVEKIQRWFMATYQVRCSIKDAVNMAIHTSKHIDVPLVKTTTHRAGRFSPAVFVNTTRTSLTKSNADYLDVLRKEIGEIVGGDANMIANTLIRLRAETLPDDRSRRVYSNLKKAT